MVHLDTSFLFRALLSGTAEGGLLDRWISLGEQVRISSIAWCEFLCGPHGATIGVPATFALGSPIPFGSDDAAIAANLFNATGRRRGSLGDCMIAAAALQAGAKIATSNVDDFSPV